MARTRSPKDFELPAQALPAQVDVAGLELSANRVNQVIGQYRDEQVPGDTLGGVVKDRPQTEFGFQTPKHGLQVGEHGIGAPQRGRVPLVLIGAQAVDAG